MFGFVKMSCSCYMVSFILFYFFCFVNLETRLYSVFSSVKCQLVVAVIMVSFKFPCSASFGNQKVNHSLMEVLSPNDLFG